MCSTLNYGVPGLAVIDHTFILRLALQLVQGVNDALHTLMASSLTASMALVGETRISQNTEGSPLSHQRGRA